MKNKNNGWLLWVLLILIPPVGIIYMWIAKREFTSQKKKILTAIFAIWFVICMIAGRNSNAPENTSTSISVDNNQSDSMTNNPVTESPQKSSDNPEKTGSDTENTENDETTNNNDMVYDFSAPEISFGEQDISNLTIKHGELLSVVYNDGTVIVKAKITPSYNNNATIVQNYFNVTDLIKKHGFNTCKKLEYWAVADMTNGKESKCISFSLNKKTIKAVYKEKIVDNQLNNYISDLWILPSLQD